MPIFEESRYVDAHIVALPNSAGIFHATVLAHKTDATVPYNVMVSEQGDTFASIAWYAYRDAEQWWRVADLNPDVFYPGDLKPGTLVRVPRVPTSG